MLTLLDDEIRDCLEGAIPVTVATCSANGVPNVTFASQAHFVDSDHIALSYQFFNKTRENILSNPRASVALTNPSTAARYHLDLEYRRTESSGPLFESIKARLAGIASHAGMAGVFRLLGADVYRVVNVTPVWAGAAQRATTRRNRLTAVKAISERIVQSPDLNMLFTSILEGLELHLGMKHSMLLMLDVRGQRLFTVASRGYPQSGVGSEMALGCGVIGVAAEQRTPIRISHLASDYTYSRAIRDSAERAGFGGQFEMAIPFPGLADSRSQLAVPLNAGGELMGVLYVESPDELRFTYEDEDAMVAVAAHVGLATLALREDDAEALEAPPVATPRSVAEPSSTSAPVLKMRHFLADDSIFLGEDYLIKGVAGAILAKLVREYQETRRTAFTNRELRLDAALKLPDYSDNLEARLVLLQRRLAERSPHLQIEKTGRGRFRLQIHRPVALEEVAGR